MNDVSVIRVSRCGITRGTLYGKHVLTLIWMVMTGGSFKIVSNWTVLTGTDACGRNIHFARYTYRSEDVDKLAISAGSFSWVVQSIDAF